jgi:hypothetical protein
VTDESSTDGPAATDGAAPHKPPAIFNYVPHGRTKAFIEGTLKPVRVIDTIPQGQRMAVFNRLVGVKITNAVGTMACAYLFTLIALVSFPSAIKTGSVIVIISWIAQTFLQLVLLSIIMVGQNVQAQASDKRSEETYKDAEAVLHEATQIQEHLQSQDALLSQLLGQVAELERQIKQSEPS